MGDFADESGLGEEAHLFFTAEGAVESFPLPEGGRRWIVQTPAPQPADAPWGPLRDTVQERTGILLQSRDQLNQSVFTPGRMDAEVYFDHRVILCGDAAHAMSPIGGQGMNVGFADAEMLAHALTAIIRNGVPSGPLLQHYQKTRQAAARVAANRAASGMWLGTWRGRPAAWLRDLLMRQILFRPPLVHHLGPRFAMTTLPRCRVAISAPDSMFRT
jgi:2-polyprenyl-6-methoxyphenol hydroxylase-like FAD-dependent oxidoreductase